MPPSVFRGRVVADGEPLWLDSDREEALALLALEASECPGCGEPREVSMALESDGAYAAEVVKCHACAAMAQESRAYVRDNEHAAGVFTELTRRPGGSDRG